MSRNDSPADRPATGLIGRRNLLQLGGLTVAAGAVIAACGDDEEPLGRVGYAPPTSALPDAVVNDVVLLRTASSMEHSIVGVYERVLADDSLLDPANVAAAERFRDDHLEHAATFERLTTAGGGEAWSAPNPRIEETVVTPAFAAIIGAPATTPEGAATPPSDDPTRDVLHLLHALETISTQSYQALMTQVSQPSLREEAIGIAAKAARRSATLAIAATGRPEGYVNPSDVPAAVATTTTVAESTTTAQDIAGSTTSTTTPEVPATPIPPVHAINTQFGGLAALSLVIGAPNEAGSRKTIILDTPSLNTFVYEYMEPAEG